MITEETKPVSNWSLLQVQIHADPEYAWAIHCNIAMPLMDELKCSHQEANKAAAVLMRHLWDYDVTSLKEYVAIMNG